jgi:hypothetical protein
VFAATAALLLALGISANTLLFSVVNALLLRPLPVAHPESLVRLIELHPNDFVTWNLPYGFCDEAASRDADFSEVICQGEGDVPFSDGTSTERVRIHLVSPNFFSSLGVHAYLGRVLTAEDERTLALNAVLSYEFWKKRMHGNTSVVGRKIALGGYPFTIVGVSPEAFNGLAVDTSPDMRVPASVDRLLLQTLRGNIDPATRPLFATSATQIFARLRNGIACERGCRSVFARGLYGTRRSALSDGEGDGAGKRWRVQFTFSAGIHRQRSFYASRAILPWARNIDGRRCTASVDGMR